MKIIILIDRIGEDSAYVLGVVEVSGKKLPNIDAQWRAWRRARPEEYQEDEGLFLRWLEEKEHCFALGDYETVQVRT